MTDDFKPMDTDISYMTLSYATRLLASETDPENLIRIALDTLADYGRTKRVEFISLEERQDKAKVIGLLADGELSKPGNEIPVVNTHLEMIVESKLPRAHTLPDGAERFYLPLIGADGDVIGLMAIDLNKDEPLHELEVQILTILTTLIAVSFEGTRFYRLAIFDGLTGLFVRRQFDVKLQHEMARVKRYGGNLAIFLADIDHFKQINETHGHLQGDMILQDLSGILRKTIRKDVDLPCRFSGKELMTLMPNTDLEGAIGVAERFRQSCEEYDFPSKEKPLKVTISGSVAAFEGDSSITSREFIARVNSKLDEAKNAGHNRIIAWR